MGSCPRSAAVAKLAAQLETRVDLGRAFLAAAAEQSDTGEGFTREDDVERLFVAWCASKELAPSGEQLRAAMRARPGVTAGRVTEERRWYGLWLRKELWTELGLGGAVPRGRKDVAQVRRKAAL